MTPPPLRPGRPLLRGLFAGLAFALAMALSIHPVGWWPFALAGLPALMLPLASRLSTAPVRTAAGVGVGSAPFWAWTHGWVFGVAWPGAVLLVVQLALYTALFVWVVGLAARRWGERAALILWPMVWAGIEWLRAEVFWGGYAWYAPAQGLIESPWLASAAGVIGMHGVGVLVALLGGGVVLLLARPPEGRSLASVGRAWTIGVALSWAGLSWWGWAPEANGPGLRVAAVQTSVEQSVRGAWATADRLATMERLIELSQQAALVQPPADVIVWPETMFPGDTLAPVDVAAEREAELIWFESPERGQQTYTKLVWRGLDGTKEPSAIVRMGETNGRRFMPSLVCADTLLFWQQTFGVPMLIGTDGYENLRITVDADNRPEAEFDARYNSVFLLRDGAVSGERYDKRHLTPFGEVMPVIEHFGSLQDWLLNVGIGATGMRFDLSRGAPSARATRFELTNAAGETVRVATPICFEATSPGMCRELVSAGGVRRAEVLIGLTNDGWFDRWPVGRTAHLELSRWRSVETWTPMVRAANTGVSASVDVHGRLGAAMASWTEGVLAIDARTVDRLSPYSRGGYMAAWLAPAGVVVLVGLLAWGWVAPRVFQRRGGDRTDAAGR